MSDVLNSELSRMYHNIRDGNKLAYPLLSKTMIAELGVDGLLKAVNIYNNVQTQAKLVYDHVQHVNVYHVKIVCLVTVVLLHFG